MRLPTRTGVAYPRPTSTFHFRIRRSGHVAGSVNDAIAPSWVGPRQFGQSAWRGCAAIVAVTPAAKKETSKEREAFIPQPAGEAGRRAASGIDAVRLNDIFRKTLAYLPRKLAGFPSE